MKFTEIWRYPVKTMAGELLQRVMVGPLGVEGDRIVHVEDARGRVITSRSHPRFLSHKGTLGADGEPLVDGGEWHATGGSQLMMARVCAEPLQPRVAEASPRLPPSHLPASFSPSDN